MYKALIAYYSFSKTTEAAALEIAVQTDGELRELVPAEPYSFDYNTAAKQARSEIDRGFCPKLSAGNEGIADYEIIFAGTPNWFGRMAPPVLTFLKSHDFTGKTILPFCTHGGGGPGDIQAAMASACPGAVFLPGISLGLGDDPPEKIREALRAIQWETGTPRACR